MLTWMSNIGRTRFGIYCYIWYMYGYMYTHAVNARAHYHHHIAGLLSMQDGVINTSGSTWIRRWLRICGITMDKRARILQLRVRLTQLRDMAARGEPIPVVGVLEPLP